MCCVCNACASLVSTCNDDDDDDKRIGRNGACSVMWWTKKDESGESI